MRCIVMNVIVIIEITLVNMMCIPFLQDHFYRQLVEQVLLFLFDVNLSHYFVHGPMRIPKLAQCKCTAAVMVPS